ncbi:MAG: bifunctional nuclease family protein, partial [Acidimicrobiales bacterium]
LGARLEHVVVTELRMSPDGASGTYFADLSIRQGEESRTISCRPSDALALAVRLAVPIYADDDLLDEAGVVLEADEDDDDTPPEELVSQFRQFIEGINPEDFSG